MWVNGCPSHLATQLSTKARCSDTHVCLSMRACQFSTNEKKKKNERENEKRKEE